jgi:hypothetical protein
MAATNVQLEVEDWVRRNWMPENFGQQFHRDRVKLSCGGVFDFDAVSADGRITASISTSGGKTARGKFGVGKLLKIRSDMYFLLLADADRRVVVLTEPDMLAVCEAEKRNGRVPASIEFVLAHIPNELRNRLNAARQKASEEVSPARAD